MSTAVSPPVLDRARAAGLFHALSDETRLAILEMLRGGERCVCELQDALDAAQSRLSFHLKVLKQAGLVTDRRDGRWAYYALVPAALGEAHDVVRALAAARATASTASAAAASATPRTPTRSGLRIAGSCCG